MSCNCFWPALKFEVKSRLGICTESGGFVASSTRIRLLLNPQLFIFGFKSFPVHVAYSNGIRLFTRNFGETLDTTISAKSRRRISEFENIRIHCPHVIGFVAVCGFFLFVCFFHTLKSGLKNIRIRCRIHWMRMDRSRFPITCGRGLRILLSLLIQFFSICHLNTVKSNKINYKVS